MPTLKQRIDVRLEEAYGPLPNTSVLAFDVVAVRKVNRRLRLALRLVQVKREQITNRFVRHMNDYISVEFKKIHKQLRRNGSVDKIIADAVTIYNALRLKNESDLSVQVMIKEQLSKSTRVDEFLDSMIHDSAREVGVTLEETTDILKTLMVLYHESAFRAIRSALLSPSLIKTLKAAATPVASGFTEEDFLMLDITTGTQFPEIEDAINQRSNLIKGFDDAMFDDVRDTFKKELYEKMEGGSGGKVIARKLAKNIADSNKIPKHKFKLWARTEGAVVQNDALMKVGDKAGLQGKIWQSVGDGAVRDGSVGIGDHVSNDADGVIKRTDSFSDGSSDGGTGSISPWNCRCTVGPAMLPKKRAGGKKPSPVKPGVTARIKKPKQPIKPKLGKTEADKVIKDLLSVDRKSIDILNKKISKTAKALEDFSFDSTRAEQKFTSLGKQFKKDVDSLTKLRKKTLNSARKKIIIPSKDRAKIFGSLSKKVKKDDKKLISIRQKQGDENLSLLWNKKVLKDGKLNYKVNRMPKNGGSREFAITKNKEIFIAPFTESKSYVHEVGHLIETSNPKIFKRAKNFLKRRTKGEKSVRLNSVIKNSGYDSNEKAKIDRFIDPYTGKSYKDGTEIISIGTENMWNSPALFAEEDPDFFRFIYNTLHGIVDVDS